MLGVTRMNNKTVWYEWHFLTESFGVNSFSGFWLESPRHSVCWPGSNRFFLCDFIRLKKKKLTLLGTYAPTFHCCDNSIVNELIPLRGIIVNGHFFYYTDWRPWRIPWTGHCCDYADIHVHESHTELGHSQPRKTSLWFDVMLQFYVCIQLCT